MANKNFTLEEKIKFLNKYEKIKSVKKAAKAVGASYQAGYYWLTHKEYIRKSYEKVLSCGSSTNLIYRVRRTISLEEKIRCIKLINTGLTYREVENKTDYQYSSIRRWDHTREELLALYCSQNNKYKDQANELESSHVVVWEDDVPKDEKNKELTKKIKAQAKELEYCKDKIAFLESLNTLLKEKNVPLKKKKFSQQSKTVSNQEEET